MSARTSKARERLAEVEGGKTVPATSRWRPEEFIIAARDGKGEGAKVWARCQVGHERQVGIIVASRKFPFRTPGDLIRWCIHVGLKELLSLEPGIKSVMQQVDAINVLIADEEYNLDFQATIHAMQSVIQRHQAVGAVGEARRVVTQFRQMIQEMPDGYWKTKYLTEINASYSHLLSGKKARVQMSQFDAEDE